MAELSLTSRLTGGAAGSYRGLIHADGETSWF
jgi:hypothetical protein